MALPKILENLATQVGIAYGPGQTSIYAMKDGFPVQFFEAAEGNSKNLWGVMRFDDGTKDATMKQTFAHNQTIELTGLKTKKIDIKNGIISLKWPMGITGYPKPEKISEQFMSVFSSMKPMVNAPGLVCRMCSSKDLSAPILVNGMVDRVCPKCIEKMQQEAADLQAKYDALPTNYPLAILAAITICVVGAAIWAGVIIGTQKMYWMIAIGIGALIGWATTKAAGKGGKGVQTIVFLSTMISILLGMIFYVGYELQQSATQAGQSVIWSKFVINIPFFLLDIKGDVLFSLVGGLIGAFTAAAKAAKAQFAVKVDR